MKKTVTINVDHLIELIHWARRYADRRSTVVPSEFNKIYNEIMTKYPNLKAKDLIDKSIYNGGEFFPYAKDGDYKQNNRQIRIDARSRVKPRL